MKRSSNIELVLLLAVYSNCSGFNESVVPLVDTVVTIDEDRKHLEVTEVTDRVFPGHPESNGTHTALRWSTIVVINGTVTNETIHGIDWVKIENEEWWVTQAPLVLQTAPLMVHTHEHVLQCDNCLPPLKTGPDLYLGMAQWNSLVCGGSVCNNSLVERPCGNLGCDKCHCDPECTHYGDCCPDVFQTRAPQLAAAKLSCLSVQFIESKKISSQRYKMVSDCPEGSSIVETDACLVPDPMVLDENRPVFSKLKQLHYRNPHCAYCNGVKDGVSWDVKPFCETYVDFSRVRSPAQLLQKLRDEEECAVHYIPPEFSPLRECWKQGDIVRKCNVTGNWVSDVYQTEIERACSLYSQTFEFRGTMYNNIFCAHCNGEELWATTSCDHPLVTPGVVPFSMLLDVRSAAKEEVFSTDEVTCSEDHVYDPHIDACRPFLCPPGNYQQNHQCISFFKSAKGLAYIFHFTLTPKDRDFVTVKYGYSIFYNIAHLIQGYSSILRPHFTITNANLTFVSHNGTQHADVYSLDMQVAILVGAEVPIQEAQRSLTALLSRPYWFYEPSSLDPVYFDIIWLAGISSDRLMWPGNSPDIVGSEPYEVLGWGTYHLIDRKHFQEIPNVFLNNKSAYIQVSGLLMCKIIELNTTEFSVNDSRTITLKHNGETLKEGEFLWNGDMVQICTNFSGQRGASDSKSSRTFDKTEVSMTLVCTSLSLCGLAITLIIYLVLPSLRTLPARNNIFLFTNLFLAQLLFLTGSAAKVSTPVCRTLAIIIHYFWMSTFCWKVVCGFHMYRLFVYPLRFVHYIQSLMKYILFAQITPCVIIALVVGINAALSGMQRFGYAGRSNLCFLSGTLDVALGFVTPVCLAVLMNVVFFTRVVYVLRNRTKIQRHTSKSDVKESILYFKMSLILGFTWILGFLALIVNDIGLWYVFTLVNASIGIFVFIGFGLKNVSLSSLLHGAWNKDHLTNSNSKTYETTDGTPTSDKNGKYSPEHLFSDSECSTPVKRTGTVKPPLP